jgi:hypothetical protein
MQSQKQKEEAAEAAGKTGTDPAIIAAGASVLLSWHYFFLRDDAEMGMFVGLWPPTILAFASYFKQTHMSDMMRRATSGEGIVSRVERVMNRGSTQ